MKNCFKAALTGVVLACIASFALRGGYEFYSFKVHGHQKQAETEEVKKTIKFFSGAIAGFYATDGSLAGLNLFPAEKGVKRRIFHDIRNWEANGKLLVMDRDKSDVRKVLFLAPDLSVAEVDEKWFSVFQDRITRRQIAEKNVNIVTVRYYLKKKWGRWIVIEYEVAKQDGGLPPVNAKRALQWG